MGNTSIYPRSRCTGVVDLRPSAITSAAVLQQQASQNAHTVSVLSALKEIYGGWVRQYYHVEGAKEELLRRIKELPLAEKVMYGISEDGEDYE